ncbi:DNA phosphorothioation-associated putative methyltransferase [Burkholderia cenocepacia]|uniref:DNA phosphorothioation-associated putative methyltransferase n=1 Tax=Burkholderia cenocepacia TaxID=95486 RepID=UPI00222F3175|nr:DNA phosphorothioation-associated putative methyltransferase [Burkholderia cenocepacia]MCW3610744.1 DNA phosphorothioation-associated putative methyltransferase [Burkholderia cenocepacia]MCW5189297.1 DNA phosphorothioation-associated putative methyltransferase [Burkholderia cenocepacia]
MEEIAKAFARLGFGKRVVDDLYIHRISIELLGEGQRATAIAALESGPASAYERANVIKLNLVSSRFSLLRYDDFFDAAFPVLLESWSLSALDEQGVTYRSYLDSLNPPILHRKELLLPPSHPLRPKFEVVTRQAEELGLFDETTTIGFRENWSRLVAEKGYTIVGSDFVPIGNVDSAAEPIIDGVSEHAAVHRHLTALSRWSLSAPVQLLLRHALLSPDKEMFDYGCGKGDDIASLNAQGYTARGWDPFYAADNLITQTPVVNLGFVLNVIEDQVERREALHRAFQAAGEVLAIAVMLGGSATPGLPYRDGVLTSRNTFQKYFSQEELRQYVQHELGEEAFLVGPGVCFVFKDKNVEQRFTANRYRRRGLSNRILKSPHKEHTVRPRRVLSAYERLSDAARQMLTCLWEIAVDLGRVPESDEVPFLAEIERHVGSLRRAVRFIETNFDRSLLSQAAAVRADDLRLFFAMGHFSKRQGYRSLETRLQQDIKAFFGDYRTAQDAGMQLLKDAANLDTIRTAARLAAEQGIGYLDKEDALHLHVTAIDRLPVALRAYVGCGLLVYGEASEAQLIKIHSLSGKLSLFEYEDFDASPLPLMVRRIKVNIRRQDYEIFEYGGRYEKPYLYFKSRYLNEEYPRYAEQSAFDMELEQLELFDSDGHGVSAYELADLLEVHRRSVHGFSLRRSDIIPPVEQPCGRYFRYRDFIECGETQQSSGIENVPQQAESFNALHDLATKILDPLIDYFGGIKLTYGFCSHALSKHIKGRIAPQLDQHASYERSSSGKLICDRGGAACDFIVPDEDMEEVSRWITENLPFDRLYFYGKRRPIHVSYAEKPQRVAYEMRESATGRRIPRPFSRN